MKVKTFYQVCVVFPDLNFLKKNWQTILITRSIMKIKRCWYENVFEDIRHVFGHLTRARGLGREGPGGTRAPSLAINSGFLPLVHGGQSTVTFCRKSRPYTECSRLHSISSVLSSYFDLSTQINLDFIDILAFAIAKRSALKVDGRASHWLDSGRHLRKTTIFYLYLNYLRRWSFLADMMIGEYFPFLVRAMKLKIDLKWNYDMSRNETFPNIYFWNVSNYSIWALDQYLMRWPPSDYLALASLHFNCQP